MKKSDEFLSLRPNLTLIEPNCGPQWLSKDFMGIVEMDFERILQTHYFLFKSASSPSVEAMLSRKTFATNSLVQNFVSSNAYLALGDEADLNRK